MSFPKAPVLKVEIAPLSLVRLLYKHRLLVLTVVLLGSAASWATVYRLPSAYQSEALILLDPQIIPERYVPSSVSADVQDRLAAISQQVLSSTRLEKIIDDLGLYKSERTYLVREEILERMRKDISIKHEKVGMREQPVAFHVGYEGSDPKLVKEVASRLANLFIQENLRTREREAQGTADFIDSHLQEAKARLDESETNLNKYKLAHNGYLPEQESALNAALLRFQIELQGNQDAINRGQQTKVILQATEHVASTAALGNAASREDGRMEDLKKQIALADREIEQRNIEHSRILKSIAEYQTRVEQLPLRELEMAGLNRDFELAKVNYRSLLDKTLVAGMATDMERRQQAGRFTMLDPPRVPERPVGPKRHLLNTAGFALSLALATVLVIVKDAKSDAVLGEWELPEEVIVLGRIPNGAHEFRTNTRFGEIHCPA